MLKGIWTLLAQGRISRNRESPGWHAMATVRVPIVRGNLRPAREAVKFNLETEWSHNIVTVGARLKYSWEATRKWGGTLHSTCFCYPSLFEFFPFFFQGIRGQNCSNKFHVVFVWVGAFGQAGLRNGGVRVEAGPPGRHVSVVTDGRS